MLLLRLDVCWWSAKKELKNWNQKTIVDYKRLVESTANYIEYILQFLTGQLEPLTN